MDCRVEPGNDTMLLISGFLEIINLEIKGEWLSLGRAPFLTGKKSSLGYTAHIYFGVCAHFNFLFRDTAVLTD